MKVEVNEYRTIVIEARGKSGITKALKKLGAINEPIEIDSFTVTTKKSVFAGCKTIKP